MGDALLDLQDALLSKQETLTPQEVNVFRMCKSKAVKDFTLGAGVASGIAWTATQRLSKLLRFKISFGAAIISGMWRFGRSLDSSLDYILAMEGSRMQKELATIIVNKYQDDPWRMQLISKHFYSEEVYDDSTSERPKLRWRYRNFFGENPVHTQSTHDIESHSDAESKKTDLESKQVPLTPGIDAMDDPLDCILGYSATTEEIHHPDSSRVTSRMTNRSHRRSHRRHRMRHQDVSSNHLHA